LLGPLIRTARLTGLTHLGSLVAGRRVSSARHAIPNSEIRLYHESGRPTDELPHKW